MESPNWHSRVAEEHLTEAHKRLADCIGVEATLKLCDTFGGASVHIPLNHDVYRVAVTEPDVYTRYLQGAKVFALARMYGVSEPTILRYIRRGREKAMEVAKND